MKALAYQPDLLEGADITDMEVDILVPCRLFDLLHGLLTPPRITTKYCHKHYVSRRQLLLLLLLLPILLTVQAGSELGQGIGTLSSDSLSQ